MSKKLIIIFSLLLGTQAFASSVVICENSANTTSGPEVVQDSINRKIADIEDSHSVFQGDKKVLRSDVKIRVSEPSISSTEYGTDIWYTLCVTVTVDTKSEESDIVLQ